MRQRNYKTRLESYQTQLREECSKCKDSGVIDTSCQCFSRLLNINTYLRSGIPEKYWNLDLNTLEKTIAPVAVKAVSKFIANLEGNLKTGRGAYIWSSRAQSGKSTLSYIIMKAALRLGKRAFKASLSDCASAFDRRDSEEADFLHEHLTESDLVVIDNLGDMNTLVHVPSFQKSMLEQVYTTRTNNNQSTIITSNLPVAQIPTVFGIPFDEAVRNSADIIMIP